MYNELKRFVPNGFIPYEENPIKTKSKKLNPIQSNDDVIFYNQLSDLLNQLNLKDEMTFSFHHHLRNGDAVMNMIFEEIDKRNLKNISIAPSAIFPVHVPLVKLIEQGQIKNIYTNYINGPVADAIQKHQLKGQLIMDTHGGRPRAIESGEINIDIAFIAVPACDHQGNGNGVEGPSACGTLGYATSDLMYAKQKVLITDTILEELKVIDIENKWVDYVLKVDHIGDPKGIVSGTTKPTKDPIQIKIAKDTVKLLDELGYIKDQMSFQTGAGGTSLAVANLLKTRMLEKNIQGSFASGGITGYLVDMHEKGLFERLYDVQCFDIEAIKSYLRNPNHLKMSASEYANPNEDHPIVNQLDVVILGATEIDLDFNVNVTTDSKGRIIGGSGGHSDTAFGAKLSIITTNLVKSRNPIIRKSIQTITTPGSSIDVLVTERGIAINPKRVDLISKLNHSKLNILPIHQLYDIALEMTGEPKASKQTEDVIGVVRYRDGSIIDSLYSLGDKK